MVLRSIEQSTVSFFKTKNMKVHVYNLVKWPIIGIFAIMIATSCSKWDDFKEYIADGEIVYVGRLDSVKILSGNERVQVKALLKPDPNISQVRVFWNDMADSMVFNVDGVTQERTFDQMIPMAEGIVSLMFFTYDSEGNKSVGVSAVGRAYGPRYQNGLSNRLIENAEIDNGVATIHWADMDRGAGPFATEVKYMTDGGTEKVIRVPLDNEETQLNDLAETAKSVAYRTLFLPQSNSIDTFYTDYTGVGLAKDVTEEYLKNTKVPVVTSSRTDRWGIPADWITNTAVRNFRDGSGTYFGGVDYWFGGPFLAMEAGWSADNMASINNGKIYQRVILPAGSYTFEMDIPDCTAGGDFYTVATVEAAVPDIENIASSLGFVKTNTIGTHALTFLLEEETEVAIGFVGNLPNKGSGDGTFWRITAVRLKQTILVE